MISLSYLHIIYKLSSIVSCSINCKSFCIQRICIFGSMLVECNSFCKFQIEQMTSHIFLFMPRSERSVEGLVGWLFVLRIYIALAVFSAISRLGSRILPISEIQVARRRIEPRTSCSAIIELNHSATATRRRHQMLGLYARLL